MAAGHGLARGPQGPGAACGRRANAGAQRRQQPVDGSGAVRR